MPAAMPIHPLASALFLPSLTQASDCALIPVSTNYCDAVELLLCTSPIDVFP